MAIPKQDVPQGGVTINLPVVPAEPQSPEPVPPVRDTVVIPTGNTQSTTTTVNQSTPGKSGPPVGLIVVIVFFVIALLGAGGWFIFNKLGIASGPVTLTYWGLWENDSIIAPVIADFEAANPKIKIQYVKQSYKQYRQRLQAAISRGEGPDIFRFHNTWVAMMRDTLSTVPPTVMKVDEFASTFYPVAKNDLIGGSNIYGIPIEIDGLGLYVNQDLFAAAGAVPPATWEDVLTLVPQLTVKNEQTIVTSAIALGTTTNIEHWSDILATMMMQNGARLSQPTGKEAEEALLFFSKFANAADPVYTWNTNMDNSVSAFANGRLAMMIAPSWRAFDVKQINPSTNFKIEPIPQLPGSTANWASYWVEGVSAKSKNKEAAWQFVKYLASRDAMTKMYTQASKTRLFGEPYSRKDMAQLVTGDQFIEAYIKQAESAQSFPLASRTFDEGLNDQMIKYLEDAVNGLQSSGSPTTVLATAAKGFQQVLSQYGLISSSVPASQ